MNHKIAIVGGGFAGLETALSLKHLLKTGGEITLFDRKDHQSFLPSIHEILSGKVRADDINVPIRPLLEGAGIEFIQNEVQGIELKERAVVTPGGTTSYDYLVLACGAETNFYGISGAAEFAHGFRSPEEAERIREKVESRLEAGNGPCRILIAGGGLEGVEIAGELFDLISRKNRKEDFRNGAITVEIIEGAPHFLPECHPKVQAFAEEYLRERGITIAKGSRIIAVRDGGVTLESGEEREMSILIWTAGVQPAGWLRDLPLAKDSRGWLKVTEKLRSEEEDHVFAVGDIVTIMSPEGPLTLPRVAFHAQGQARVAALNIHYALRGHREIGYHPKYKPQLISLGGRMGILTEESLFLTGPWVIRLKKYVERQHVLTYRYQGPSRAITDRLPGAEFRHVLKLLKPL